MTSKLSSLKKGQGPKFRQITVHLRNLIKKAYLKPGARLPTDKDLAKLWNTNHFTVHKALTPLVTEGLIERGRRSGTFIRDVSRHPTSVAIYYGGNVWHPENAYFQALHVEIEQLCLQSNRRCFHFVDMRPDRDKSLVLPALQKAIDQGEIQGIIGVMISRQLDWLQQLQLPLAPLSSAGIHPSLHESLELVLSRFASDGCRTVGLVCPSFTQEWHVVYKNVATRLGLKIHPAWVGGGGSRNDRSLAFGGYRLFKERWNPRSRPDGIFVYPDIVCQGVIISALELGVKVPQDLRMIFHRNTGLDYLCPWKIPSVVVDVKEVAALLMDYLDANYRHEDVAFPTVNLKLVDP